MDPNQFKILEEIILLNIPTSGIDFKNLYLSLTSKKYDYSYNDMKAGILGLKASGKISLSDDGIVKNISPKFSKEAKINWNFVQEMKEEAQKNRDNKAGQMKDLIKRLEGLIEKSSPLPWVTVSEDTDLYWYVDNDGSWEGSAKEWSGTIAEVSAGPTNNKKETAQLIAEGISALPILISEIKRLEDAVNTLSEYAKGIK